MLTWLDDVQKKKSNPLGIGEIRNMIYAAVLQGIEDESALAVTWLELDPETDKIVESTVDSAEFHIVNTVPKSGRADLFGVSLQHVPKAFHEFLSQNALDMTFVFTTAESLVNFTELFNAAVTAVDGLRTPISVAIRLFDDNKQFGSLEKWKELEMPHGYREGARRHVEGFVDAVQPLPHYVNICIVLERPWRDYRALRGVTAPLRENGRRELEIAVSKSRWKAIPEADFHLSMTVAGLQGRSLNQQAEMDENEARGLVKYGCRGLRTTGDA